uniref:Uncharacterized protein n=1 Tax=Tetranychus urticae TaxID=32264 RepID=T1KEW6_TETUR
MSMLMGKVIENVTKNVVRLAIPQLKFDTFLCSHFRESSQLFGLDSMDQCKVGDWVLLRKLPEKISTKIDFKIEQVLYQNGHIICPLTGKRSFQYFY